MAFTDRGNNPLPDRSRMIQPDHPLAQYQKVGEATCNHTRWVLIREWEHRLCHESGVWAGGFAEEQDPEMAGCVEGLGEWEDVLSCISCCVVQCYYCASDSHFWTTILLCGVCCCLQVCKYVLYVSSAV